MRREKSVYNGEITAEISDKTGKINDLRQNSGHFGAKLGLFRI